MSTNALSKNSIVLSNADLKQLGFKSEGLNVMDEGFYEVHAMTGNDSFIEITNEFNDDKKLTCQYLDSRIVFDGKRNYSKEDIEVLKRFL